MLFKTRCTLEQPVPRVLRQRLDLLDEVGVALGIAFLRLLPLRCYALDDGAPASPLGWCVVLCEIPRLRPVVWRYGGRAEDVSQADDGEELDLEVSEGCGGCAAGPEGDECTVVLADKEGGCNWEEESEDGGQDVEVRFGEHCGWTRRHWLVWILEVRRVEYLSHCGIV